MPYLNHILQLQKTNSSGPGILTSSQAAYATYTEEKL